MTNRAKPPISSRTFWQLELTATILCALNVVGALSCATFGYTEWAIILGVFALLAAVGGWVANVYKVARAEEERIAKQYQQHSTL